MEKYELAIVFTSELTEEQVDAIIKKLKITVKGTQKWGKRLLSYPIKKQKEGLYYLFTIEHKKDDVKALERLLHLEENILRHLLVKAHKKNVRK